MNEHSSRSHTIFQLVVETRDPSEGNTVRRAKLNLVDLAGTLAGDRSVASGGCLALWRMHV